MRDSTREVRPRCMHSVMSDCDPMNCSPPGSSVRGILQSRALDWFAISCGQRSPNPGTETGSFESPELAGGFFTPTPPGKSPAR